MIPYNLRKSILSIILSLQLMVSCVFADCESTSDETLVLTLERAINIALSAQRRLGSAMSNVAQSEINVELAESDFDVKWIPKGDAGATGGGKAGFGSTFGIGIEIFKKFTHGARFSFIPSYMKASNNHQNILRTQYTQPLLRGFGKEYTMGQVRQAQFSNRSACRSFYLAQVRLMLQTIQALYDVVRQESYLNLEKESVARIRKFCISTKMKEKIGLCDALDVYRAEIELKRSEDSMNQASDRLQDAKDALRDTLALPLDRNISVDVPVDYQEMAISLECAITTALQQRIEIDQADDQLDETRRLQYMAKCNTRPELNLVLDYTTLRRDEAFTRIWTYKGEAQWGVGLQTSTDIGHVRENAAYDQSILNTADACRNAEQIRDNVILDVKRTMRAMLRSQEKIGMQEEQIQNSTKEFHLARVKFEHGLANNFDLIQAEKNLQSSQIGLVSAMIDHKVGQFKLLAALGMLADKPDNCKWRCQN